MSTCHVFFCGILSPISFFILRLFLHGLSSFLLKMHWRRIQGPFHYTFSSIWFFKRGGGCWNRGEKLFSTIRESNYLTYWLTNHNLWFLSKHYDSLCRLPLLTPFSLPPLQWSCGRPTARRCTRWSWSPKRRWWPCCVGATDTCTCTPGGCWRGPRRPSTSSWQRPRVARHWPRACYAPGDPPACWPPSSARSLFIYWFTYLHVQWKRCQKHT